LNPATANQKKKGRVHHAPLSGNCRGDQLVFAGSGEGAGAESIVTAVYPPMLLK
jgi:hypothetical protein